MLLTKKIRLEVSEQDAASLEFMQGKCRGLYNWHVMQLREATNTKILCIKPVTFSRIEWLREPSLWETFPRGRWPRVSTRNAIST
jgi:hypothetical protein